MCDSSTMAQDTPTVTDADTWAMVAAMFGPDPARTLARHQHDSFSDFILTKIPSIIAGFNPIELYHGWNEDYSDFDVKMSVNIGNPRLQRPQTMEADGTSHAMTPSEARKRGLTYASQMFVDIDVTADTLSGQIGAEQKYCRETKKLSAVSLGRIPIMVRSPYCLNSDPHLHGVSGECPNDPGGYFIVSGSERALISHDRMAENRTFVFPSTKCTAYSHTAEVRSLCAGDFGVPKITGLRMSSKNNESGRYITVVAHHVRNPIPLFVLFRALGVTTDMDIFDMICGLSHAAKANVHVIAGCASEAAKASVFTQDDAERYLLRCTTLTGCPREYCSDPEYERSALRRMLRTEILPHVGDCNEAKASYLADMARALLLVVTGHRPTDDRDSYVSKRVDAPGVMLANLLRQYYGKVVKEARKAMYKELTAGAWRSSGSAVHVISSSNVYKIFKGTTIDGGMRYALATGSWGVKTGSKQGVSQVLNRLTYCATLSHLRRIATSIEKNSKLIQPRKLNGTQWGIFCPAETPEGQSVGVVKNLSIGACVTVATAPESIYHLLPEQPGPKDSGTLVYVNSKLWGTVADAFGTLTVLRTAKRAGRIHPHTAIVWRVADSEIRICTEGGRMVRPLLPVQDGVPIVAKHLHLLRASSNRATGWVDLMTAGCIEYLDVEECGHAYIAMTRADLGPRHTHVEVHPSLALGVMASIIPFPDHNQSPRNSYQSAMGKQAIGIPVANYRDRFDVGAHVLDSLQRPLVSSRVADIMGVNEMPTGSNVIVAICTCAGYNQEDAVILNRSATQRGLFTSTYYHTLREQLAKNHSTGEEEKYYCPDEDTRRTIKAITHNFDKLQPDGFPAPGTYVTTGDVIVGKGMPSRGDAVVDSSISLRNNEGGFVDRVVHSDRPFKTTNGDGYSFCKVRILDPRIPEIGDKFASRSGQKGVVGMTFRTEDMPFTDSGLVPDLIMNPHAIPSRMTIAMMLEGILGRAACHSGRLGDGTPFGPVTAEAISSYLADAGFEMHGDEVMHDPRTGAQMPVAIFVAPVLYNKLKHFVQDKRHARGKVGPVVTLTRQPMEGRSRDGGLRIGEMEADILWSHGISSFYQERFMTCSDAFNIHVCSTCGQMVPFNVQRGVHNCAACGNGSKFTKIELPFACKLIGQELNAMGIGMSLHGSHS